jgi:phosphatidylglycerophosphate synthase
MGTVPGESPVTVWILDVPERPALRIWGLSSAERLRRAVVAAGVAAERVGVGPRPPEMARSGPIALFRADYVFDERLVRGVVAATNTVLLATPNGSVAGIPVAANVDAAMLPAVLPILDHQNPKRSVDTLPHGVSGMRPAALAGRYAAALRRVADPYVLPVTPEGLADLERRIFDASYKGVTDLVTKWVWPRPARWCTRRLAQNGVQPNAVTLLSWILVLVAAWLFMHGWFALGLAAGWLMTFLDTVDGKLARVTLTSSRLGDVLDHGLDLLHPPFWYLAWAAGLPIDAVARVPAVWVTVVGYVIGRLIEGAFLWRCKTEIHCWRPVDSWFRTVTARRNPNLLLLTGSVVAGRPDLGLVAVALWTATSIGFHTVRLVQALARLRRGDAVDSWLEARAIADPAGRP